jgi:hypothetical protein
MKLLKILKSKWFEILFPSAIMAFTAIGEGSLYWLCGIGLVLWVFTMFVKYNTK